MEREQSRLNNLEMALLDPSNVQLELYIEGSTNEEIRKDIEAIKARATFSTPAGALRARILEVLDMPDVPQPEQIGNREGDANFGPGELVKAKKEAETVHKLRLSVKQAQNMQLCRVCLCPAVPDDKKGVMVLDFGDEFAHRECLRDVWGKADA